MNRSLIASILFTVFGSSSAFAEAPSFAVSTRTYTEGPLSVSEAGIRLDWTQAVSSTITGRYNRRSGVGVAIEDDPTTLLATENSQWQGELEILAVELPLWSSGITASAGTSIAWWREDSLEKGYFALGGDAQIFANKLDIDYYMPIAEAGLEFRSSILEAWESLRYTPIFFYNLKQVAALKPFIAEQYSQNVGGTGDLIISNELRARLLRIFDIDWLFETSEMEFPFLALGSRNGVNGFYQSPSRARVIKHRITGGLSLDVGRGSILTARVGKVFTESSNLTTGVSMTDNDFVWDLFLTIR